jgi:hypothetical protein
MTKFMSRLRTLARTYMLSIIVCNGSARTTQPDQPPQRHPLSRFPGNSRPALGPAFTYLTDGTVWIAKYQGRVGAENLLRTKSGKEIEQKDVRVVEMLKSRYVVSHCFSSLLGQEAQPLRIRRQEPGAQSSCE